MIPLNNGMEPAKGQFLGYQAEDGNLIPEAIVKKYFTVGQDTTRKENGAEGK